MACATGEKPCGRGPDIAGCGAPQRRPPRGPRKIRGHLKDFAPSGAPPPSGAHFVGDFGRHGSFLTQAGRGSRRGEDFVRPQTHSIVMPGLVPGIQWRGAADGRLTIGSPGASSFETARSAPLRTRIETSRAAVDPHGEGGRSPRLEPCRPANASDWCQTLALRRRSPYFPGIAGFDASPRRAMMQRLNDQMRLKTGGSPLAASARALKLLLRRP